MIVTLALEFNVKGLLLLIAAVIFGVLAVIGLLPPRNDWPRGVASLGWCLALIGWFIWAAGG